MRFTHPLARLVVHLILIAGTLLCLLPLAWMIVTSLKPIEETMTSPPTWVPSAWQWRNYYDAVIYRADVLGYIPFLRYFRNTLYLIVMTLPGVLISCSLAAYGLARLRWRGREVVFGLTLATLMIPFPVTMVPLYVLFRELEWIGTFRPLWVGAWFGGAFNIFLLRQFFLTIPEELSDAARVDGANEWQVFARIILPLAKPALAVVALFHVMAVWNDFMGPLIYLQDQSQFTLALGLQAYQSQHGGSEWNMLMAASTIMVAPVIVLFFFTQRTFIQGIAATGLKG
ncbi:MAG TPA: sugar ABC transporter ATP-binding protein [Armatimonadetes bacterium]|nr:sugar ABC transporter ATP-binding protein [Armatimonadota bacterium]